MSGTTEAERRALAKAAPLLRAAWADFERARLRALTGCDDTDIPATRSTIEPEEPPKFRDRWKGLRSPTMSGKARRRRKRGRPT